MAARLCARCLPPAWLCRCKPDSPPRSPHLQHAPLFLRSRQARQGQRRHYRAALCADLKQPLAIEEMAPRPVGPHEVRVDVHFCGINFADILVCRGQYQEKPALPFTPGMEFSGVVLETGADVSTVKKGDPVIGVSSFNAMAEQCITNQKSLWRVPENISLQDAAVLPVSYGTAILAVDHRARVQPGETVLVTAAAGATGLAVIDVATNVLRAKPGVGGQDCGVGIRWRKHRICAQQPVAPEEHLCHGPVLGPLQTPGLRSLFQEHVLSPAVLPARAHPPTHWCCVQTGEDQRCLPSCDAAQIHGQGAPVPQVNPHPGRLPYQISLLHSKGLTDPGTTSWRQLPAVLLSCCLTSMSSQRFLPKFDSFWE
ncbi:quinone oxidoreductase-like protein 2 isoform X2 [Psammomys obesus]|uniref:quinone oxidoreductase-like protein 2 isoform X2 n=1 Tax=Psammomys obesus TaxID=48139 RepID=UPI002452C02E|nr:quinone oxidoreductase-like protein 2 isoform X2 [Psammomys obesus]